MTQRQSPQLQSCLDFIYPNYRVGEYIDAKFVAHICGCSVRTAQRAIKVMNERGLADGTRIIASKSRSLVNHPRAVQNAYVQLITRGKRHDMGNWGVVNAVIELGLVFDGILWKQAVR